MTIVGRSDLQPTTLAELNDYVTANAATVNYANAGVGAASHLCGRIIEDAERSTSPRSSTRAPARPWRTWSESRSTSCATRRPTPRSRSPAARSRPTASPAPSGTMRSRTSRPRPRPDRPTSRSRSGTGSTCPAGTPTEVVAALTAALQAALADAAFIDQFAGLGTTPVSADQATPEAHTKKLSEQIEVWRPIIEEAADLGPRYQRP